MWSFAAFLVLVFALLCWLRMKGWRSALLLACAVSAALLLRGAYFALRVQPVLALADTRGTVTAEVLESEPGYTQELSRVVLRVTEYDGAPVPHSFYATAMEFPHTPPGELVRFQASFTQLEEGASLRAAYADGIWLGVEEVTDCRWLGAANTLQAMGLRVRKKVADTICQYWPGDIAAVACAMSIGEKSLLSSEVQQAFRSAGLSHALVVSGLHLSVVCGFAFTAAHTLLRRRYAALVAMAAAVLFAVVTGFTPSILRAGIAMLIFYGAQACGRESDSLTSLGFAALVLCASNPFAAVDIGLLLSFSATLGVLAAGTWADIRRQKRKAVSEKPEQGHRAAWMLMCRDKLLELLAVPVCTTLATLPVLAASGIGISLVSVLCNVVAVPLLNIIVPCGLLLGCWNGNLLFEPIARLAGLFCGIGAQLVLAVANWANSLPWAMVTITGAAAVLTILGAAGLLYVGIRNGLHWRRCAAVAALFVLMAGGLYAWTDRDVVRVAVVGSGTEPAVVITQRLHTAVLFRGGEGNLRAVQRWLEKNNRDGIDLLVDLRRTKDGEEAAQALGKKLNASSVVQAQTLTNRVAIEAFCGIIITVGHQKGGTYASAGLGGISVALSVGKVDLGAYAPAEIYVAGMTQPENLMCDTLLLPQKTPAWLKAATPEAKLRKVESELCLLVRRGTSVQWKGAMP